MKLLSIKATSHEKRSSILHEKLFLLYSLVSLFNIAPGSCEQCLVSTNVGTFRGVPTRSRSVVTPNFLYCSFLGIRYAQPPTGNLRFARPVLAAPLAGGVYNATADGSKCPQFNIAKLSAEGNEDCLFLNVFTPQMQSSSPQRLLPVMIFIHGSGFLASSSDSTFYGADNLVPKNVVLVTMNYRLNAFGFLNLEDEQCSGNMGLADQILSCRWVQNNIRSFGGDPNNVTLFGESAGGHSTYLLSLSPQARGLFQRVIIESTIFTTDSYLARDSSDVLKDSIMLARMIGYIGFGNDHKAILRYLKLLPAAVLSAGYFALILLRLETDFDGYYHAHGAPLFPCVDSSGVQNAIIPTNDFEVLGASVPPMPFLIGFLDADGSIYTGIEADIVSYVKNHLDIYLKEANPIFVKDKPTQDRVIAAVKARYYNPSNNDNEVNETVKLLTFLSFYNFYKQIAHLRASYAGGLIRTFLFRFAQGPYDTNFKQASVPKYATQIKGAIHGEEILYLFYLSQLAGVAPSDDERRIIDEMTTWWTNFAKTGNPNSGSDAIQVEWEPSTSAQNKYLEINNQTRQVNTKINQEDYDFFAGLEQFARGNQAGRSASAGSRPAKTCPKYSAFHNEQIPPINYGDYVRRAVQALASRPR